MEGQRRRTLAHLPYTLRPKARISPPYHAPEAEGYLDGDGNRAVLDAGIVTAAQRFEHYEIAAYGSAISFARQLKRTEVADLLQESLDEETAADEKLTSIAENGVNDAAMKAGS